MFFDFLGFGLMASAISANKVILYALKPEFLTGIRMTVAGLILGGYAYLRVHHRIRWSQIKKYMPLLIVVSLFTTYFPSNLKAYALANMASSKMAFFGTLDPFVTSLYSYVIYREKLSINKILGIILGFIGMIVLVLSSSPLEEQLKAFSVFSYPELAAFWAIVLSRFGWIQAQQILKKDILNPIQINIVIMLIGGIVSLITAFARNQTGVTSLLETPLTLFHLPLLSSLSSMGLLVVFLAYTTIVGNVFGYTLYAHSLKRHSAVFISLASFSIPLFVSVFGWAFLNEPLSVNFFIACTITFLGLVMFSVDDNKKLN